MIGLGILPKSSRATGTLVLLWACAHASTVRAADETYHGDIRAILQRHCVICHGKENIEDTDTSGGLALDSPEAVLQSPNPQLVVAGKPGESQLLARLIETDPEKRMPKDDDPLPAETIDLVRRWIEKGAAIGTPMEAPPKRSRTRPRVFRDLSLSTDATPPAKVFGEIKPAALELVAKVAPLAPVTAVSFSPDGTLLAVGSFRRIVVWNLTDPQPPKMITDPIGSVNALAFAPDGQTLWVGGGDPAVSGEILGYEVRSGSRVAEIRDAADVVSGLAISPDGGKLASISLDRHLRLHAIPKMEKLADQEAAQRRRQRHVAFSPDGRLMAPLRARIVSLRSGMPKSSKAKSPEWS
ncbi:MAG: c-type cytochrome domain-containing protein [Planctomycetota bacterium]